MKRLQDAGLFGGGLTSITSPKLVARYNEGLAQLGIDATTRTQFSVDGVGWSPEVAEERGDPFYLSAGVANPMGIIITPDQRGKPVWVPTHSFLRDLMAAYFERFAPTITEITSAAFIGLNIDDALTTYEHPRDLLLVTSVVVHSLAGGLFDAAREQRDLCERFMREPHACLDDALRQQLIASGKRWGDLRYRRVDIPDWRFDVGNFWTAAFGGAFVLRPSKRPQPVVILEDGSMVDPADHDVVVLGPEVVDRLRKDGLMSVDMRWYKSHPEVIEDKLDGMLASVYCQAHPTGDYASLKQAQKTRFAAAHKAALPSMYHELQLLRRRLDASDAPKGTDLSSELQLLLTRPRRGLPLQDRAVVWQLLCRVQPLDVLRLYKSDKNLFFRQYVNWPESLKAWAITLISERYAESQTIRKPKK